MADPAKKERAPFHLGKDFRFYTEEEMPGLIVEREKAIELLRLEDNYQVTIKEAEESLRKTHEKYCRNSPLTNEQLRKSAESLIVFQRKLKAQEKKRLDSKETI